MSLSIVERVSVFAPATVSNLGPGFDLLGLAIEGPGDTVTAYRSQRPGVTLAEIRGDEGKLPLQAQSNTAGIAALATLRKAGLDPDRVGIELILEKGMPIGSGLGSSAASAAAAALATNLLIGSPLRKHDLIETCIEAEASVSGRHADNVAPALLGGLILVKQVDPLDVIRLPIPAELMVVVALPNFTLSTRVARAVLPHQVPLQAMVRNSANIATLVAACYSGDLAMLGRCIEDEVVTPPRARLIPGCTEVIQAALSAGALGASISGAGPSIFALCHAQRSAHRVARAMLTAFKEAGLEARAVISPADCPGARRL